MCLDFVGHVLGRFVGAELVLPHPPAPLRLRQSVREVLSKWERNWGMQKEMHLAFTLHAFSELLNFGSLRRDAVSTGNGVRALVPTAPSPRFPALALGPMRMQGKACQLQASADYPQVPVAWRELQESFMGG